MRSIGWVTGMLLRSLDAIRGLDVYFIAGQPVETGAGCVTPVYLNPYSDLSPDRSLRRLRLEDFRRLHESGSCAGCIDL
jgi:hypothetical protein